MIGVVQIRALAPNAALVPEDRACACPGPSAYERVLIIGSIRGLEHQPGVVGQRDSRVIKGTAVAGIERHLQGAGLNDQTAIISRERHPALSAPETKRPSAARLGERTARSNH